MRSLAMLVWFSSLALAGCGGDGSGSNGQPPIAAPAPAPTPIPSPVPTPVITLQPNLASAVEGSALSGRLACSTSPVIYSGGPFGVVLSGLTTIAPVTLQQRITLTPRPSARLELIEPGGTHTFNPLFSSTGDFASYFGPDDFTFMVVARERFAAPAATFGLTDVSARLCFFAAGLTPVAPPTTIIMQFRGLADGLAQSSASTSRLAFSRAEAEVNFAVGTGTFQITLQSSPETYQIETGEPSGNLGTLSANLTLNGTEITASSVSGPAGYSGTLAGQLVGDRGMALVFEIHNTAGEVIWGAAALDAFSPWDY